MNASVVLSFLIGGVVASSFKTSVSTAKNNITSLSEKIKGLAQTKLDISSIWNLAAAGKTGTAEFAALEKKLKKSGINTANLLKEFSKVNKSLLGLQKASVIDIKLTSNIDELKRGAGDLRGLFAVAARAAGFIYAQSDILQAQGELKSLGMESKGIERITAAAKAFSNQYAGTTAPEFIRASYDIKSGISNLSDEGVAEFTRLAALTGQATKSTTADMTKLFALGYGIFRGQFESDTDFANQFSNAISASVQAFRTDGPDLVQGLSNLSATATTMGVSLSEQLAIIGTSKEAFNSASDAATGYRAFLDGVGKAEKELGLTFTDAAGKMLPMTDVLDSIKEKFGDTMESAAMKDALKAAFGSAEAAKTILELIDNTDALRNAQKQLAEEMKAGTITENIAKAMQKGKELELLQQRFINFSAAIGKILYPAFSYLATAIGFVLTSISGFIEKHQTAANVIGKVTAAALAYIGVLKSIVFIQKVWALLSLFSAKQVFLLRGGMAKLNIVTRIMAVGQWLLNAAMLANPMGLIAAAIVALIGIGIALYKNWDKVKKWFTDFWNGLKESVGEAVDWITEKFSFVSDLIDKASGAINYVKSKIFGESQPDFRIEGVNRIVAEGKGNPPVSAIGGQNVGDKYFGSNGLVAKASSVNNARTMTYAPQVTVQGNANREDIDTAINGGMKDFERNMFAYNERRERLSYAGGY